MKYLAAYLLLASGGKASPTAKDITTLLGSVGVEAEQERVASLIKSLEGKSVDELIAEGKEKIASVPTGGVAAPAAGASGAAQEDAKVEAAVEEKEESDDDMGFGLFD
ncbi:60s acidic ribosomal protein-domain-containing protein [Phycomyces blakesleeanus]|uniref:Ribosomal protein 60S n=2 Tax=Phycomyces blakesleeanus TaxID=4837 RepID=A0A167NQL5_PHYB8|nr:hypothetical protein PHYBLDRAFT_158325 [Phycomyces blakesleeanus NRRL 1555(-)]OAD76460.1 hypothetical protein PHYBLDRAFT_158325 [Phycomyces blakesleeanus NRRL 1555(-)]|eukprot:XP_018294500.1 hypothetical protein PHYBLDRAFT_158325 [Phycomyces blakesleeanus NRRL 1555(-)]